MPNQRHIKTKHKMKNDSKSTLFVQIDSMVLRLAIPFCKQRRIDLDSFITQAIEMHMELVKSREEQAKEVIYESRMHTMDIQQEKKVDRNFIPTMQDDLTRLRNKGLIAKI